MFSVTGSIWLYLKTFRFFIIFKKKLFRVLAVSDSVLKISHFSLILILYIMRHLSKSKDFTDFQNSLLLVTLFIHI